MLSKQEANRKVPLNWDPSSYSQRFPVGVFSLDTDYRLALHSDDYKHPRGARFDNSVNRRFNQRIYQIFSSDPQVRLLDLGCAGGGLVLSFIADGHVAIGLEGSDSPLREQRGAWGLCPNNLFTCDITRPFTVRSKDQTPAFFDVITAWEVLEHIAEGGVPQLLANISSHLRAGGIFVGSVDLEPDGNPLTGACYHQIFKDRAWWLQQASNHGLLEWKDNPFETLDFVRGTGQSIKDWSPDCGTGFHLILRKQ